MINHGLSTGALFLLVGMLYDRTHTRDLAKLNGLGSLLPIFGGVFLFVAFSSIGLPGLNGFVGEFLVILGTFIVSKPFAVAAVTGLVLSAIYMLWAYQRLMHGPPVLAEAVPSGGPMPVISGGAIDDPSVRGSNGHDRAAAVDRRRYLWGHLRDLDPMEYCIIVPIMAAILFIGLYPKPILQKIEPSANHVVRCAQAGRNPLYSSHPIVGINPSLQRVCVEPVSGTTKRAP
jgi:NADH-quinone oxidoreductase subunit M